MPELGQAAAALVTISNTMSIPEHGVRLEWSGKSAEKPELSASLELIRQGNAATRLVRGDNLHALSALAKRPERAMLVYLDPPFFTGREHNHVERSRGDEGIVRKLVPAFDDRWESLEHYLGELAKRLRLARDVLDPAGCLVLHVDPKTSHYAKVLCDEIFGLDAFASEIVWRYRRWPAKTKNFQRVHDVLLRYVRDPSQEPRFQQLYEPLAASTEKTWGTRKQRAVVDSSGRRTRSSVTEQASPGAPLGDVWDISIIAPVARERTGYPTQKPEALLERLIQACTAPSDIVLDPYCGSGTTLAVASRLGRRGIGIDQSEQALAITYKRLESLGVAPQQEAVRLEAKPSLLKTQGRSRAQQVA
ncbi:MAG TPA: site-specific DNA-methyltransferase [Polyangiaceae bacterium]|nr:site-specific DNA-methyltransferase [Polyangiaceae bacterium]